jgi:L-ascorbate metabolism protein UlaG (beta-lactamase superfamily)
MTSLRWLGHATVLLELGGARLLTDPLLRPRLAHLTRRTVAPGHVGRVDAVLISHVHRDHLDMRSLAALPGTPPIVAPAGARDLLQQHGLEHVIELREGERTAVAGVTVTATAALHPARRGPLSPWVPALGFVIESGVRVYFAGDTDLHDSMRRLAPLDVALLPVWGWGTSLGAGHLNPRTAAEALLLLRPRLAIPIHWGTFFPIGRRGRLLTDPPLEFARHAAELAPEVEVRILAPDEVLELG